MKKILTLFNIFLLVFAVLLIINYLLVIIKKQEHELKICEMKKKAMVDAYSDIYYYYKSVKK